MLENAEKLKIVNIKMAAYSKTKPDWHDHNINWIQCFFKNNFEQIFRYCSPCLEILLALQLSLKLSCPTGFRINLKNNNAEFFLLIHLSPICWRNLFMQFKIFWYLCGSMFSSLKPKGEINTREKEIGSNIHAKILHEKALILWFGRD